MKLLVLVFAGLGLALELAHVAIFKELARHPLADHALGAIVIAGFAVPALIALVALKRPIGGGAFLVAAACFVAVFLRLRMWDQITRFADLPLHDKLLFAAAVGGALVSVIAGRRR